MGEKSICVPRGKKWKTSTNILFTPDYGCCLCSLWGFFVFSTLSIMNSHYFYNEEKSYVKRIKLITIDKVPLVWLSVGPTVLADQRE